MHHFPPKLLGVEEEEKEKERKRFELKKGGGRKDGISALPFFSDGVTDPPTTCSVCDVTFRRVALGFGVVGREGDGRTGHCGFAKNFYEELCHG